MRQRGSSGRQDAKENVKKVTNWIAERNSLRDWDEYKNDLGKINRTALSVELDFGISVPHQNPAVKRLLQDAEQLWFKKTPKQPAEAAQEASIERSQVKLGKSSTENNKLTVRVAELEAENRQLQKELASFRRMRDMIESGMPGFKI